jgi:hypothetical protein
VPPVDEEDFGELDEEEDSQLDEAESEHGDDGQTDEEGSDEGEEEDSSDPVGEEGEDEGEEEDGLEEPPAQKPDRKRTPSDERRSASRWQRMQSELAEARRARAELEARDRSQTEERQRQEAIRQQQLNNQEAELLAQMTPEERSDYRLNKMQQTIDYQQRLTSFQLADSKDKAEFDAKCRTDPVYKKYGPRVEEALALLRKQNQNMPRETLLVWAIGEATMKAMTKGKQKSAPVPTRKVPKHTNSRTDTGRTQQPKKSTSERQRILDRIGDIPL